MSASQPNSFYLLCNICSQPILIADLKEKKIICPRCGNIEDRFAAKSKTLTLIYSLTALFFYLPANFFPFMTIELYGNRNSSTIWGGILSLLESGSWPIALVVFLASMVIPFLKLLILFTLTLSGHSEKHPRLMTRLYQAVETLGRWSMLDIFLLAVLVALMKLGPWTVVKPEIGSLLFILVVIFTMLASANFDPRLLWKEQK